MSSARDVPTAGLDHGQSVDVPTHSLTVRDGGERVRLEWWDGDVHARALFRVATGDGMAVLVSASAWRVSQRDRSRSLGWDDSLDVIPPGLLLVLRGAGYTPTEGCA